MTRFGLTDNEFVKLTDLVPKHMLHDKGKNHNPRPGGIWCHKETGQCKQLFPKAYDPNQECSYVDKNGYVTYIRRTSDDAWVVPYNPRILLDFLCLNFDSITFTSCPSSQSPSSGPSPSRPRPRRQQQRRTTHPTRSPRSSYSRTSSCALVIP